MQYDSSKLREYIQSLDTIGKDYDFEYESASFFQIDKIKPEIFIKNNVDEKDSLTIINALLEHDIMPDYFDDYNKDSLIELAIKNKCSVEFIKELIDIASKYNLDIIGIASNSLKLMIIKDYSSNEIFEVITKFFEYGYNYLNDAEYDSEIVGYLKNKYNFFKLLKLVDYGKKGYQESISNDLFVMYQYTAVNPKNIVIYLLPNINNDTEKNMEKIRHFFKCDFDRAVKMINYISEINFEIDKTSKAYNGLKIVLDILLSQHEFIFSDALYNLFCGLIVQKDISLLINILKYFKDNDFDFEYYSKAMLEVMNHKFSESDIKRLKDKLKEYGYMEEDKEIKKDIVEMEKNKINEEEQNNQDKQRKISAINEEFQNQGRLLNYKNYISMPGVGRDEEIENVFLGLARRNGSVILVGESGVGKTEIANRLAWQIQNNHCPNFLKDRIVVEISLNSLIAGCTYRGSFEQKMKELFNKTKKYSAIVVINEIHNIFGLGASEDNKFDLSEMLKTEIEEGNIQVIGTTTKAEYDKYFANSALKRRFKKVDINELDEGLLYNVFEKHINDLCEIYNVTIDKKLNIDKIINIIINNTKKRCRVYNDRENNPALGISIIEDAFAYTRVYDKETVSIDDFIYAFKSQDRIYETSKNNAVSELELLKQEKGLTRKRANIIDITSLKRY